MNLDLLRARRRMAQSFQFANSFVREECMDTHYTYLVPGVGERSHSRCVVDVRGGLLRIVRSTTL